MGGINGSFLERFIRAVTRGGIPIDASQCDGPCVVQAPADVAKTQGNDEKQPQSPIRWVSLR